MMIMEPSAEMVAEWRKWVDGYPEKVRNVIEKFVPWKLYKLKCRCRVLVTSFDMVDDELSTLCVFVSKKFNKVAFDHQIFDIKPDELEPCNSLDGAMCSGHQLPIIGDVIGDDNTMGI